MSRRKFSSAAGPFAIVATLVGMTSPAAGEVAHRYATIGKWNVQFNETECLAIQEYSAISPSALDKKMTLLFKYSPSGNVIALHAYRPAKTRASADQREISLQFDGRPELRLSALRYGTAEKQQRWLIDQVNLGPAAIDQLRKAKTMTATLGGPVYQFPLMAMDRVVTTLDQCRKALSDHWNIDLAIERLDAKSPATKPKNGLSLPQTPGSPPVPTTPANSLFSSDDYPAAALFHGQSGLTHAELLIDETGKVRECFVNETSGVATLDVMTCLRLMHATYRPALDGSGKPARSYDDVKIKWVTR